MDEADQLDEKTFKVNFMGDGVAKLRDRVKEKLKEFMGDYTDDTLVEYVIVLLRNGRRKKEARNELNVFLGDDSDSFVSWLWDHLESNLNLYAQPLESYPDEVAKSDSQHLHSESEREKSAKISRRRHNREWKGLARDAAEPPPLRSSIIDNMHAERNNHRRVGRSKRSLSPRPLVQRKRNRPDDRQQPKREGVSEATIAAPRRLLQFAVRDAVATSRPANMVVEPKLSRLRSVVSTSTGDSLVDDRPQRMQSIASVPYATAVAIKAVAEAAKDVFNSRPSGNVFDRLGRGMGVSDTAEFGEAVVEDEDIDPNQILERRHSNYLDRGDYRGQLVGDATMFDSETGFASDLGSDSEGYDGVNLSGRRVMDKPQTDPPGGNKEGSLMMQYSVAKNADQITQRTHSKDQDQPASLANASRKIVNISVNVNTWKPPHYQAPREVADVNNRDPVQESEVGIGRSGVHIMKENSNPVTVTNGSAIPAADTRNEFQKTLPSVPGSYSTVRPLEDADSRTIFVNNVHFAATKDSLSRHFNKFGEVLKVVIVTDAATGQPKGSAYVEFMRKEAAEHALSLDGTSFMSRILKVVKRSSAHQEAAPAMTWPRVARGSPFSAGRFSRGTFPRGISGAFRPRHSVKPGARSLQWKRDAQASPGDSGGSIASNNTPSPIGRGLTYVRTEPKADSNSGTT